MHSFPWLASIVATLVGLLLQFASLAISANVTGEVGRTPLIVSQSIGYLVSSGYMQSFAAYYAALLIAVHVVPFALVGRGQARLMMLMGRPLPGTGETLLVMFAALLGAMAWSYSLVPDSNAVVSSSPLFQVEAVSWLLRAVGCGALMLMLVGAFPAFLWRWGRSGRWWWSASTAMLLVSSVVAGSAPRHAADPANRPNLIILGLDSVRPDFIGADGLAPGLMPFLERLKASFVSYDDAETPIARTGVSWAGVLSGAYPVDNGARFNLYARTAVDDSTWLPRRLKAAGYRTAYVTDDSRFSNIDAGYGFDMASHPPIGIQDFVYGTVSDFVPINLLRHISIGKYLLPHAWANRAAHHGYRPDESSRRVIEVLRDFNPEGHPFFLAAHLCTAHYPYLNPKLAGTLAWVPGRDVDNVEDVVHYAAGLRAADEQLALIWRELEAAGALSNAVVVLMSDHGESLGLAKDQLAAEARRALRPQRLVGVGHGTVGLSDAQHRTVLLVQRFVEGRPVHQPGGSAAPASLIDIAPTLLAAAGLQAPPSMDGMNLLQGEPPADRIRFRETDLRGGALAEMHLDQAAIAREFSVMFELTSEGRVQIRQDNIENLLRQKQRIAHKRGTFLAHNPDRRSTPWVMYWPSSGEFSDPDFKMDPVAAELRGEICRHWQRDLVFHSAHCVPDY